MAKGIERLNAVKVAKAAKRGKRARLSDGNNLYLQVVATGSSSWVLRYVDARRRERWLGLGPYPAVDLHTAREKARVLRRQRIDGLDPITERAKIKAAAANMISFATAADRFVDSHGAGWRNAKYCTQWRTSLRQHADPIIGAMPVSAIETPDVMRVIEPLWRTKPDTGDRLRNRIERVLAWAEVLGLRSPPNPARWKDNIDHLLPSSRKVRPVKHHAALSYCEMPAFMMRLREQQCVAARALEFTILTCARSGEVLGMTWNEIDLRSKVWTVPGPRMKAGRMHRVPLVPRAIEIITGLAGPQEGLVFRRPRDGALSVLAMAYVLKALAPGVTTHGMRPTFRIWSAERTSFPRELAELSLAHATHGPVEAAYQRSDLLEQRRALLRQWSAYCEQPPPVESTVVLFAPAAR